MKYKMIENECELTNILWVHLKPPPDKDVDFVKEWIGMTLSSLQTLQTTLE
jgi:hypothetical protein